MNKHFFLLTALFSAVVGGAWAQQPAPTAEELYAEGRQLYIGGHYIAAGQVLEQFLALPISGVAHRARVAEAEYMMVCMAYSQHAPNRYELIQQYLAENPYTLHANRLHALSGNALYASGAYALALESYALSDLEQLDSDERDESTLCKAVSLLKTGDLQEAYALLSVVQSVSSRYEKDACYYKAYIDYVHHRYDEASSVFVLLKDDAVYGVMASCYLADIRLEQGEYEEASDIAENMLAQRLDAEQKLELARIGGEAAYGMKVYDKAVVRLGEYVEGSANPRREALYKLGMSWLEQKSFMQAVRHLTRVTDQHDALAQHAFLHSGMAYVQLLDLTNARLCFEQASLMDFSPVVKEQALYNYALCLRETSYSGFGESIKAFERFLSEYPNSPYADDASGYLVEAYMSTRNYRTALQSISRIKNPDKRMLEARGRIHYYLGTEALVQGDYAGAEHYFNESLKDKVYDPAREADALFWRAEARYRSGNLSQASNDYTAYLRVAPAHDVKGRGLAYYNLGYTAFGQKKYQLAQTYFERFLRDFKETATSGMQADALSRIGDCQFQARQFVEAEKNYRRAAEVSAGSGSGDYALYGLGLVQGLQKNYAGKVQTLDRLITAYPNSDYQDDALYEQGRAYILQELSDKALQTFSLLMRKHPESPFARKAAVEIGLLHYQHDRYEEAISAYQSVISRYPGSEEARSALRDLKSVYVEIGRVDGFAEFARSTGNIAFERGEQDSLTFISAEKSYMRKDFRQASEGLNAYLQEFPDGFFCMDAHYYLALMAIEEQQREEAGKHLDKVLEYTAGRYAEEAMVLRAEMAFQDEDYPRAISVYKLLKEKTAQVERIRLARVGILRAAGKCGSHEELLAVSEELLADEKLSSELKAETLYLRAKAAVETGNETLAAQSWKALAGDTRSIYGAEAKYRIAEMLVRQGNLSDAEKELLDYLEVSTPHAYWLARSIILLSDIYMQTGRDLEAKGFLLSLKQNYPGTEDDIAGLIEERLAKGAGKE